MPRCRGRPAQDATRSRGEPGNQRYSRIYGPEDDPSYQQCRNTPDVSTVIIGALLGGLIGNAAGQGGNRTGATVAGVILGGAVGAAMTSNLDCQDRSYAYRTNSEGFNGGRANRVYAWSNPNNNHRGQFKVGNY